MNMNRHVCALLLGAAACSGSGSDVGPRLDHVPNASNKVLVLDDAGNGVAAATVTVAGKAAVTGRSGRGDLFANPAGRQLVTVAVDNATARADDRLQSLAFAAEIPGSDLPLAIFVPDTSASAGVAVSTGTPLGPQTADDGAVAVSRLLLGNNTTVVDTPAQVTLRVGHLAREHLPGELPVPASGARLWSRGVFVEPASAQFLPAGSLDIPDDLQLGGATNVELWHLDAASGEWTLAASGAATASGGRLQFSGGVSGGGLYAFATGIAAVATVRGRLRDLQQRSVYAALVRVDAVRTTSDNDGRFAVTVPATFADGTPRAVNVDLRGGAVFLPVGATAVTPTLASGADVDLGDVTFDTIPAGNCRFELLFAGAAVQSARMAWGSSEAAVVGTTLTDARGQATMEEVPAGFFGFLNGRPQDRLEVQIAEAVTIMPNARRWLELRLFFDDRNWVIGARSTRTQVIDDVGTGPVRDAAVVRGSQPGQGFSGLTRESGVVFVGRAFDGRATATARTTAGSDTIVSAFTIERPNGDHLEMPVRRARRQVGGAFDRHGTLAGNLLGAVPGTEHRLRAGRALEFGEWFDQVMLGEAATNVMPTRVDTASPPAYRAGVALPSGNVVAVEGTTAGSVFTPTAVGGAFDVEVPEGTAAAADLTLRNAFTAFTVPGGFTDLDPALTVGDFRFDLALQRPSGLVVDVARGIGGGIASSGTDAVLQLPVLTGEFAGSSWLCAMSASDAAGTVRQQALYELAAPAGTATPLLAVPSIAAPSDGAVVAASGFGVDFTLPAGTLYATIELDSPGADARHWTVVVPPDLTHFDFVQLPTEAHDPLEASRSYTLTLTAARADTGFVLQQQDPYRELTTLWHTIGAGERGVRALSSRTIRITAN